MNAAVELRVLSGRHAGARALLAGGERVGPDDGCDLILTDLGLPLDVGAWVQIAAGHWWVRSTPEDAASADTSPPWVAEQPLGSAAYLGQVAVTVSLADAPWQAVPQGLAPVGPTLEPDGDAEATAPTAGDDGGPSSGADQDPVMRAVPQQDGNAQAVPGRGGAADVLPREPSAPAVKTGPRRRWHPAWIIGAALAALLLSVFWSVLQGRAAAPAAVAPLAAAPAIDLERQQRLVREVQLAIARVDPALRLRIDALPAGGVRVSGWVADIAQLDRLAEGLADVRPVPALSVRTASDLMDDLIDAGGPDVQALRYELLGEGRVRAYGLVMAKSDRDKVLALVRARVPPGIDIVDGLRVASDQGGAVQEWLRTAGFAGAEARWDGEQMVVGLDIGSQERARLESVLARPATPLAGIPFVLRAREVSRSVAQAPAPPAHASAAPLPFRIRSVVGGAVPYVVLGDGSKLQPGGRRAGWRLVAVEPDRLVFDGPRSLVVLR
ncbi:type III secretion system inner membrane ring subunit SctD [Acidovorax sp.]|uniref:type III secretion system inner membrane ring subunit SctD n=1 Tax=Acidovorax sp. TaxID=1872122 RepID=UPI002633015A|nr:type III secretion system inner membrane ring subunit SctD [Acidovorax sp.]